MILLAVPRAGSARSQAYRPGADLPKQAPLPKQTPGDRPRSVARFLAGGQGAGAAPLLAVALVGDLDLVARLVLFPAGALASVPLWVRLAAFAGGLATHQLAGRTPWKGVCAAAELIAVGKLVVG